MMGEDEKRAALRKYGRLWKQGKGYSEEGDGAMEAAMDNGSDFHEIADVELRNTPKRKQQEYFEKLKGYSTAGMQPDEQLERVADLEDLREKHGLKW